MVLPFGLNSDGEHMPSNVAIVAPTIVHAPSAPPAFLMPGQTNVSTVVPVIPSPYIDFIVVNGDDRYMIRCERKAVLENSVELAKIIHAGPNSGRRSDNHFQISNVDKHDFELVVRFLETKFVKYRDHLHIIRILELADRYNCPDLVIHCIRELDLQLTSATAVDVFRALWFYQSITPPSQIKIGAVLNNQPDGMMSKKMKRANKKHARASNPTPIASTDQVNNPKSSPFTAEEFGVALLYNTLQLIDMHAELILTKAEISELRFEELELIVKRDTLQLSSELVLVHCLADWSSAECKRKNLDLTAENRRRVLGPLCYSPRYLLMSAAEFKKACDRIELLDSYEIALVSDAIEGKKVKSLSNDQNQLLEKFRTPRPEFAKMPIHLSDRSNPKNYPKKMRRAEKNNMGDDSCIDDIGLNCLAVFAYIFD